MDLLINLITYTVFIGGIVLGSSLNSPWLIVVGVVSWIVLPFLLEYFYCAMIQSTDAPIPLLPESSSGKYKDKLSLIYHPSYNITACGLENCHPFDSVKYRRVVEGLGFHEEHIISPPLLSRKSLTRVHSPSYLAKLHFSISLTAILEVW